MYVLCHWIDTEFTTILKRFNESVKCKLEKTWEPDENTYLPNIPLTRQLKYQALLKNWLKSISFHEQHDKKIKIMLTWNYTIVSFHFNNVKRCSKYLPVQKALFILIYTSDKLRSSLGCNCKLTFYIKWLSFAIFQIENDAKNVLNWYDCLTW